MKTKSSDAQSGRVAVIGGGASGIMAALHAAAEAKKCGKTIEVVIFEAKDRIGKKILVTGNGRCNLTNLNVSPASYFGAVELFSSVYPKFNVGRTVDYFRSIGLLTYADEAGRVYPKSNKAASVTDALLYACESMNVVVKTNAAVSSIEAADSGYLINGECRANAVILAGGGKIDPSGKTGNGVYSLLRQMNVHVTRLSPALTGFIVSDFTKSLKGIRAQTELRLLCAGKELGRDTGEVQYTDYGISGIPAMQLSCFAARCGQGDRLTLIADSVPDLSFADITAHFRWVKKSNPDMPAATLLSGIVPKALGAYFLKCAQADANARLRDLNGRTENDLIYLLKQSEYRVKALRGYENAQVTSGGIAQGELTASLMLKRAKGIYACGEVIDINGFCGGYNLQWAWSSGAVAGRNAVRENF